jgi:hypothetical protein
MTQSFLFSWRVQVQVEHAGTPVKTTDAGTVTEWEHFDYGYHSGTETDCNFPSLISFVKVFFIENHSCNLPAFFSHSLAGQRRGYQRDSEGLQGKTFL